MSPPLPDRAARRVRDAIEDQSEEGLNELEGKLYVILGGLDAALVDEDVQDALALSKSPYRHVLNALLLVKADDATIAEGLDMTPASVTAYRELFFDPRVFRNAFQVRTFIANLENDESEEFKAYNHALVEGAEALIDRYRVGEAPPPDPQVVVSRAVREFISRSREHRGRSLSSKVAQESLRCARDAVGASAQLHSIAPGKTRAQEANDQLKIALEVRDTTIAAADSPVPINELIRSGPLPPTAPK